MGFFPTPAGLSTLNSLVPERLDGIERGGAAGGHEAEEDADPCFYCPNGKATTFENLTADGR
jgi:hypothetical protein